MAEFIAASRDFRGHIAIHAPIQASFELFSPLGERAWVPGWNPELLHPPDDRKHEGPVAGLTVRCLSDAADDVPPKPSPPTDDPHAPQLHSADDPLSRQRVSTSNGHTSADPSASVDRRTDSRIGFATHISGVQGAARSSSTWPRMVPNWIGGAREGRAPGTSVGSSRWVRIRRITAASISATSRNRPPHRGQAKTSNPKLRCINCAQSRFDRGGVDDVAAEPGSPDRVSRSAASSLAGSVVAGTLSRARQAACAPSTP